VGGDEVRAVGTAFQVRRVGDHAQVVLEEGRVAVYQGSALDRALGGLSPSLPLRVARGDAGRTPSLVMTAGQEVRLGAAAQPVLEKANIPQASAWRHGRLIFDATPLARVAEDLNAADVGPRIVLSDPALADIRVSGVFHAGRPRDVVAAVAAAFPVRVASDDGARIVLAPR
jgi:transmembrane sensor